MLFWRVLVLLVMVNALAACGDAKSVYRAAPPSMRASHGGRVPPNLGQAQGYLRRHSFTPRRHILNSLADGSSVLVIASICSGSADSHCQAVDAFVRGQDHPVWHGQFVNVLGLTAAPGGFAITSANYAPQDPLCCPSGPPRTTMYHWTGTTFVSST